MNSLRFVPCGDRALMVYLGDEISSDINAAVHALAGALRQAGHPAIAEITPGYHSLMVDFDPVRMRPDQITELVRTAARSAAITRTEPRLVEIPVCYAPELGPDLARVAEHTGLSVDEVIARHAGGTYQVFTLGFSPGFPYLGGLEPALHAPRLPDPRTAVPAGSVAIGGSQTGIYPTPSPGGWNLIGRTPIKLFEPLGTPPSLLEPGDGLRFAPITLERYRELAGLNPPPIFRLAMPEAGGGKTGLRILSPGLATTVQDLGRRGYMQYGVPIAGAADFVSLMVGNWLVGNRARAGALEMTMTGVEVEFTGPVAFALTGANMPAELIPADGGSPRPVPAYSTTLASPHDRLRVGQASAGCRGYLCVAGGIDLAPILGSVSEDLFGGIGPLGRTLSTGDWLPVGLPLHAPAEIAGRSLSGEYLPPEPGRLTVRAVRGPQDHLFADDGFAALFGGPYTVSPHSDRQGVRFQGPSIRLAGSADILSEPVPAGAIQVPAGGQPILLMNNRNTMGGYAKIAVAIYPDLSAAAQLRPGESVRFQEIDPAEAHHISWAERRRLAQVRRHLERGLTHLHAGDLPASPAPTPAPVEVAVSPAPMEVVAPPPAAATRMFRIHINDIEVEAEVEEVEE